MGEGHLNGKIGDIHRRERAADFSAAPDARDLLDAAAGAGAVLMVEVDVINGAAPVNEAHLMAVHIERAALGEREGR